MKSFNFSSTRGLLRKAAIAAILAAAVACFSVPSLAGPKGTIHVRPLGDRKLTIDGDIADWPLAQFKKVAEQPVFPAGRNADSTTADGDHLVFDKTRIGLFNGTTTEAFQANESDFGVTTYFAHDLRNLYLLAVFIDDTLRDDNDTSQFGSSGFLTTGSSSFSTRKATARIASRTTHSRVSIKSSPTLTTSRSPWRSIPPSSPQGRRPMCSARDRASSVLATLI